MLLGGGAAAALVRAHTSIVSSGIHEVHKFVAPHAVVHDADTLRMAPRHVSRLHVGGKYGRSLHCDWCGGDVPESDTDSLREGRVVGGSCVEETVGGTRGWCKGSRFRSRKVGAWQGAT